MEWCGLATSFKDEHLGFELWEATDVFRDWLVLRDQFTGRKRPKDSDQPQLENQTQKSLRT